MIKITSIFLYSRNFEVDYLKRLQKNNFIQKLVCSFHDYDNFYFVSKLYDKYDFLDYSPDWNENQIRFFSACLIQALIGLKKENIIYEDIKFDNIVLDEKKYFALIDFHSAFEYIKDKDNQKEYINATHLNTKEIMEKIKYNYNYDYFKLGRLFYYIASKEIPYRFKLELTNYNKNLSFSCIDFIKKLLINDNTIIGLNSIEEIKNHDFFKNFNWSELIEGKMKSPFTNIPLTSQESQESEELNKFIDNHKKIIPQEIELLNKNDFKKKIINYDYINNIIVDKILQTFNKTN